jgi:hypothetical protein
LAIPPASRSARSDHGQLGLRVGKVNQALVAVEHTKVPITIDRLQVGRKRSRQIGCLAQGCVFALRGVIDDELGDLNGLVGEDIVVVHQRRDLPRDLFGCPWR